MNEPAPQPDATRANVTASPSGPVRSQPGPWTDSPWFWMAAFAYVGLIWLAAFGPKYALRQEMVERRFEARQEIARRRASGELRISSGPDASPMPIDYDATSADVEPQPHELLVPLEPLVFLLALVLEVALAKLLLPHFAGGSSVELKEPI